jgi:serine/threonine-protein kinase
MAYSDWQRLQELFEQVVALPAADRDAFLAVACGRDTKLKDQLLALLKADDVNAESTGGGPLNKLDSPDNALIGTIVGAWKIIERIGVGGMGSVFLAERSDGSFEQRAALKIVKKGMDTESVVQRFRQERQILARLDHPNIARVLDGGVTVDGRPYFAMEYVNGTSITSYCDEHKLDVEKRLKLFRQACNAVHAAHRNLIVHRDLKPSNIIVTHEGELKLLDFGIAKILDDSEENLLTRTGFQLHTPAYAAPEQLLEEPVTTATDVYALGVILYELLSGRRPFEVKRSAAELRKLVITGQPPKPSTAVTTVPADTDGRELPLQLEQVGANRRLRIDRLQKALRGDLDTICLMALHRDPNHRYPSADQMAADIERHQKGMPVVARPDSLAYRVGKFWRRNKAGVLVTTAMLAVFVGMGTYYTLQLERERDLALQEQRKANEVVGFVTGLFEVSDPSESRGEEITVRDLLDEGALRIGSELVDRPGIKSTMQRVLGEVYYSLGAYERAREFLETAQRQQQSLYGDNNLDVATTKLALGLVHQDEGDLESAESLYLQALDTRLSLLGENNPEVMEATSTLAFLEESKGNYVQAETLHAEVLDMARRLYAGDHQDTAEAMTKLAGIYRILDRPDDAEPLLRDAIAMQDRVYGGRHPESDDSKRQLAGLLRDSRRFDESKMLYLEIIESRTRMLGLDHVEVAHTWNSYSQLLSDMGDIDGAVEANRQFIVTMERAYDGPHPSMGAAYNNRAILLRDQGDLEGALENYQMSVDMQDAVDLPARHPNRSFPTAGIASVYLRQHRYAEAEPIYRDMIDVRREAFGEDHLLVTELKNDLGAVLAGLGEFDEAESLLTDAYQRFLEQRGTDDPRTTLAAKRLAEIYTQTGDEEKAATFRELSGDRSP